MGSGRWSGDTWASYSVSSGIKSARSVDDIYKAKAAKAEFIPSNVSLRESRDSADNPNSNAIIVGLDVTGSMGAVLDRMAREGLNTLATEIYNRKPVTDPHIMYLGIGDADAGDRYPFQCTQFEADIRIAEQLQSIYLEKGGGGNNYEGYNLAWYFGAMMTSIDCFEKRGKKGYLFTVGDEETPAALRPRIIHSVFGDVVQGEMTNEQLLAAVSKTYNVYHIMVAEGSHFQRHGDRVRADWARLLGQNAIMLTDHNKLAEVIVSTIQFNEGADKTAILKSWDGSTAAVVATALDSAVAKTNGTPDVHIFE